MSDTITRAREHIRAGRTLPMDPWWSAIDVVLERGQAAEEGLAAEAAKPSPRNTPAPGAELTGYRTATLELAELIAAAILKAASE